MATKVLNISRKFQSMLSMPSYPRDKTPYGLRKKNCSAVYFTEFS